MSFTPRPTLPPSTTRHPGARRPLARRLLALSAGTALAAGAVLGLSGCGDADAQTPYPERTESGTPVPPDDDISPAPETAEPTPAESDFPSPVPSSEDDSGTLDG
ncbi:hypothetical protein ACEXQD_05990 [Herbiconiux sp. P15]|uniref:hypothetical protein n=1 Tax=Herbiconiux liukaitaii TaxID=3342799 RepID=UPI0035B74FF8